MRYILILLLAWPAYGKTKEHTKLDNIHALMMVIAHTESGIRQTNSKENKDIGIFQIHQGEIKRRSLDAKRLEEDVLYQYSVALTIMAEKYKNCRGKNTWPACYHSATPRQHKIYWNKMKRSAKHLGIDLNNVMKEISDEKDNT